MQYGIITPISELDRIASLNHYHLVLAHIADSSSEYRNFYRKMSERGDYITLDNSDYELEKEGKPCYGTKDLIDIGNYIKASEIMAPEQFGNSEDTIQLFENFRYKIPSKFRTFGTVHGETIDDLFQCFLHMKDKADTIGISCRLIFNTLRIEASAFDMSLARTSIINYIIHRCIEEEISLSGIDFHLLGMNHPFELLSYGLFNNKFYDVCIRSVDSSCCYILGKDLVDLDTISAGYEKPKEGINFYEPQLNDVNSLHCVIDNIKFINNMIN